MSRGFNLEFRMYMEGVATPFKSANIICTPNGVEANINIYANRFVYDLKPKTAVQIFYKDWTKLENQGWRLMFDGFYSAIVKEDQATEGRMVSITCRDFRADIRKAPAYLSYCSTNELSSLNMYSMQGLYQSSIVPGSKLNTHKTVGNREYDNQLCSLADLMRYIAGTAYNKGSTSGNKSDKKKDVVSTNKVETDSGFRVADNRGTQGLPKVGYFDGANKFLKKSVNKFIEIANTKAPTLVYVDDKAPKPYLGLGGNPYEVKQKSVNEGMADAFQHDEQGKAKCGLFLDAFIRGIWSETAGGSAVGVFMNKRLRMDKRFFVPSNRAGYNFWNRQSAGIEVGGYMMGDSRFSSLEAVIMRCAALFSVHVYSCNTPTLIPVSEKLAADNPYSADKYAADVFSKKPTQGKILDFIIDDSVRKNLVDNVNNNFGGKYILNQSMLLPPFEFTAPPNCNIFLPPFCNRTYWQFDIDAGATRGYYQVTDSMSGYDSSTGLGRLGIQVPNTLFDRSSERSNLYKGASKIDEYGRYKPPITLEERYKGISMSYGDVNQDIAMDEVVAELRANKGFKGKIKSDKIKAQAKAVKKLESTSTTPVQYSESNFWSQGFNSMDPEVQNAVAAKEKEKQEKAAIQAEGVSKNSTTTNALRRHAILKFLNEKYAGNVLTIDMMFNPYPMCGFPGMYVDDEEAGGSQSAKTVIGMVQQVKHLIIIGPNSAEASTTIVLSGPRFIDDPSDTDEDGNALYMKRTDIVNASFNRETYQYYNTEYRVASPIQQTGRVLNSQAYDMAMMDIPKDVFAKDFLSITQASAEGGRSNIYYLDKEYDPQHVPLFYKKVLRHSEDSFMIGSEVNEFAADTNNNLIYFVYDSMHEAVTDLRAKRKDLLYDYDTAMRFVSRNVCSADAFYQGILGLSVITKDDDSENSGFSYTCNDGSNSRNPFQDSVIHDEYFGVTTDKFYSPSMKYLSKFGDVSTNERLTETVKVQVKDKEGKVLLDKNDKTITKDELRQVVPGLMEGPGEFSSILETSPVTAFIRERKDVVKKYINEANKIGQGMRFTAPEESNVQ